MSDKENRQFGSTSVETLEQKPSGRDANGRFAKGNPGQPKGSRHRATLAAEALLDGEAEALTRAAIEAGLAGEPVALRLCLERIIPARKSRPVRFAMPPLKTAADATIAMATIVEATAAGDITPDEAEAFTRLVEAFVKVVELTDLERRVRELEAAAKT
jgi:hypothetical protein